MVNFKDIEKAVLALEAERVRIVLKKGNMIIHICEFTKRTEETETHQKTILKSGKLSKIVYNFFEPELNEATSFVAFSIDRKEN